MEFPEAEKILSSDKSITSGGIGPLTLRRLRSKLVITDPRLQLTPLHIHSDWLDNHSALPSSVHLTPPEAYHIVTRLKRCSIITSSYGLFGSISDASQDMALNCGEKISLRMSGCGTTLFR